MGVTFTLSHQIDFTRPRLSGWLWYSHGTVARGEVPTDRPVVSGWQDPKSPGIRMAEHYFLTDFAHQMLPGGYQLTPLWNQQWRLDVNCSKDAAVFKLVFL